MLCGLYVLYVNVLVLTDPTLHTRTHPVGFLKDDFYSFVKDRAVRADDRMFVKQLSKFLRTHASSGHKKAIDEMLAQPEVASQMGDVKAAKEVQVLADFYKIMSEDESRAMYGYNHVFYADEQLAIKCLLVTDRFFMGHAAIDANTANSNISASGAGATAAGAGGAALGPPTHIGDFNLRKKYVALADSVKLHGGEVYVFSSMHVSGMCVYARVCVCVRVWS